MTSKKHAPKSKPKQKLANLERWLPWVLIGSGVVGLIASFVLTLDKLKLAENPQFQPTCNINPVISCGNVMNSAHGAAFGFPNPWLGLAAFSVLITIGMAMFAGAKFKRWFWLGLEIGIFFGLLFALWLLHESIYTINALCPFCLAVDVAVITLFWYVTLYLFQSGMLSAKKTRRVVAFAQRHHFDVLIAIFLIIIAVILNHFWYYYGKFL